MEVLQLLGKRKPDQDSSTQTPKKQRTVLPTPDTAQDPAPAPVQSMPKRKSPEESHAQTSKKQRNASATQPNPAAGHYFDSFEPILSRLRPKYNVKTMSVMPSTSIQKHVDKVLGHIGQFDAWDLSAMPGVVFFSASLNASNKLVTIAELVKRRIGESEKKWYQYNVLRETECEDDRSRVEETFMGMDLVADAEDDNDEEEEYFQTMEQTPHAQALDPPTVRRKSYMSIFFSRVPIDEIRGIPDISLQTNEAHVDYLWKKRQSRQ